MDDLFKLPRKTRFGDHVPPAVFPSVLGLFGLGLAWRKAGAVFQVPEAVSQLILGAVTLLFVFAVCAYLLKVLRRPAVVAEDMKVLPGRAGLAAMALSLYLLADAVLPFNEGLAYIVMMLGVAGNIFMVASKLMLMVSGPEPQRTVNPVWHLIFTGFILMPLPALSLGWVLLSEITLFSCAVVAVAIWGASLGQLIHRAPPVPLRPLLAFHLMPASLLGIVALELDRLDFALGCAMLALLICLALVLRASYIMAAGFSPLWGAFTFPLAAFAMLMLALAEAGQGELFRIAGGITLVGGTLLIPAIAVKVMQSWAKGQLAPRTNAARV